MAADSGDCVAALQQHHHGGHSHEMSRMTTDLHPNVCECLTSVCKHCNAANGDQGKTCNAANSDKGKTLSLLAATANGVDNFKVPCDALTSQHRLNPAAACGNGTPVNSACMLSYIHICVLEVHIHSRGMWRFRRQCQANSSHLSCIGCHGGMTTCPSWRDVFYADRPDATFTSCCPYR